MTFLLLYGVQMNGYIHRLAFQTNIKISIAKIIAKEEAQLDMLDR